MEETHLQVPVMALAVRVISAMRCEYKNDSAALLPITPDTSLKIVFERALPEIELAIN